MKHCCEEMSFHLKRFEIPIIYGASAKVYAIPYKKGAGGGVQILKYCPWCSKELPKGLEDEISEHLGSKHPTTGKFYKPPIPGRVVLLNDE